MNIKNLKRNTLFGRYTHYKHVEIPKTKHFEDLCGLNHE